MSICKAVIPTTTPPKICGAQRYQCGKCGAVGCAADAACPRHNFNGAARDVKCLKCGHLNRREV